MAQEPIRSKSSLRYKRYGKNNPAPSGQEPAKKLPSEPPELVFDDVAKANDETLRDRLSARYEELKAFIKQEVSPRVKKYSKQAADRIKSQQITDKAAAKIKNFDYKAVYSKTKASTQKINKKYALSGVAAVLLVILAVNLMFSSSPQPGVESLGSNPGEVAASTDENYGVTASETSLAGVDVIVSRQELPQKYRDDPLAMQELAQSYGYYESLDLLSTKDGFAYLITRENGQQVTMMAIGDELVLINADSPLEPAKWLAYIEDLD